MKSTRPPKRKPQRRLYGVGHTARLPDIKCKPEVFKVLTEYPRERGLTYAAWARAILLREVGRADLIEDEE